MQLLTRPLGCLALVVLVATLAACGSTARPHARQAAAASTHGLPGGPPANWDNPIRGRPVKLSSILGQFQFPVRLPLAFGTLRATFISRDYQPGDPPENLVLELVYDHPRHGRVVVLEHAMPPGSRSDFERWQHYEVESSGKPGMYGTAELVRLSSGSDAIAGTNSEGTGSYVDWYERWPAGHDFEIDIFGQAMDQPGIVSLAEQLSQPSGYRTANSGR